LTSTEEDDMDMKNLIKGIKGTKKNNGKKEEWIQMTTTI